MLITKDTLVKVILYMRKMINLPTDNHTMTFIASAPEQEMLEIWCGLNELVCIFQNVGNRTFAYVKA